MRLWFFYKIENFFQDNFCVYTLNGLTQRGVHFYRVGGRGFKLRNMRMAPNIMETLESFKIGKPGDK